MGPDDQKYRAFLRLLETELVPACGCTEPIALAYGAAVATEVLGCRPESVLVEASGNIIKNAMSVIVPNTGGLKGIKAAAAAGIIAGDAAKRLEVIARVPEEAIPEITRFLADAAITVRPLESDIPLDFTLTLRSGEHSASVHIAHTHTEIVSVCKDGERLFFSDACGHGGARPEMPDTKVGEIFDFVNSARLEDLEPMISRQLDHNCRIAEEGLRGDYGANVGKSILAAFGNGVESRAKATAAAGSDARMNGCTLPVIILSGSGNQGIAASVPLAVYAEHLNIPGERLIRAVVLSDLLTLYQKSGIGTLSAFCGAVCAGCAAGAGIAYLCGGGLWAVNHTLVNALAIVSGIICDGAKSSCAAKIASAVDAGILGYHMSLQGNQFRGGDGIVAKGVDNTIHNVARLARFGMRQTDDEIIRIMAEG